MTPPGAAVLGTHSPRKPPSDRFHSLVARALAFSSGALAYKAVALVTMPVLVRLVTPAQLGILDIGALIASIVALIAGAGLDNALTRYHADPQLRDHIWSSSLALTAGLGLCLALMGTLASSVLAQSVLGLSHRDGIVVAVSVVYGVSVALTMIGLTAVRLRSTPRRFAAVSFGIVAAEAAGALIIAAVATEPVPFILSWWAFVGVVASVALLTTHLPTLGAISLDAGRTVLRFGAPFVVAAVSWLVGDLVLRALLANATGLGVVGQYGIASRIVSSAAVVIGGFSYAWQSDLYSRTPARAAALTRQRLTVVLIALAAANVALAVLAPEVVHLVAGPAYAGAAIPTAGLAAATTAFGVLTFLTAVAGYRQSTTLIAAAAAIGLGSQVIAGVLLVPALGALGAAIASTLGYYLATLHVLYRLSWLELRAPLAFLAAATVTLATAAPMTILFVEPSTLIVRGGVGIAAVAATAGCAWVLRKHVSDSIGTARGSNVSHVID